MNLTDVRTQFQQDDSEFAKFALNCLPKTDDNVTILPQLTDANTSDTHFNVADGKTVIILGEVDISGDLSVGDHSGLFVLGHCRCRAVDTCYDAAMFFAGGIEAKYGQFEDEDSNNAVTKIAKFDVISNGGVGLFGMDMDPPARATITIGDVIHKGMVYDHFVDSQELYLGLRDEMLIFNNGFEPNPALRVQEDDLTDDIDEDDYWEHIDGAFDNVELNNKALKAAALAGQPIVRAKK